MENSAQVICIGNEIMLGDINNTNAQYISKRLSSIGIKTSEHLSIPDDQKTIIYSIKNSLSKHNVIVVTGGLGPTVDDVTLDCIAKALDRKLMLNNKVAVHIKGHFKKRGLKMPRNNMRQALVPNGAKYILNDIGTAPGLIIPVKGRLLIALPGVPFELYPMFEEVVAPYLKKRLQPDKTINSRVIKITGLAESSVNEKIEDILRISGNVEMGIYPHPGEITVKITVTEKSENKAQGLIRHIEKKINSRLKNYIFGYDSDTLEGVIAKLLLKNKKSLAIAESCTGGLLASRITDIPGSSKYFLTGVATYSNEAKNKILGISHEVIKKYGAVSKEVAETMAKNIRLIANSSIGIGISGIAGPGGGTKKKPVGLVYIAISTKKKTSCKEFRFLGQRNIVKRKATQAALNLLRLSLT